MLSHPNPGSSDNRKHIAIGSAWPNLGQSVEDQKQTFLRTAATVLHRGRTLVIATVHVLIFGLLIAMLPFYGAYS
jgi:hypothetical protein